MIWASEQSYETLPPIFSDFELLTSFEAGVFGHWSPRTFYVLWDRPRRVISFETCDTLRVDVSSDADPGGRWDLPWWRFNWWTAPDNPDGNAYWAAESPATVIADFGEEFDVDGIEVVPFDLTKGFDSVSAEYWSDNDNAWIPIPEEDVRRSAPVFDNGRRVVYSRSQPEPWADPIRTRRVRLVFDAAGDRVYVANIFIFRRD